MASVDTGKPCAFHCTLEDRKAKGQRSVNIHTLPNLYAQGLLHGDHLQVKDARHEQDFTSYKITASSLEAYERDNNRVLGKKNGELEGRLATAAGTIRELEKNQAALSHSLPSR